MNFYFILQTHFFWKPFQKSDGYFYATSNLQLLGENPT